MLLTNNEQNDAGVSYIIVFFHRIWRVKSGKEFNFFFKNKQRTDFFEDISAFILWRSSVRRRFAGERIPVD